MSHERATLRSRYFRELASRSRDRVREARDAADRCRHDETVHKHAMRAVFALEDTLFALEQIAKIYEGAGRDRAAPSLGAPTADNASQHLD